MSQVASSKLGIKYPRIDCSEVYRKGTPAQLRVVAAISGRKSPVVTYNHCSILMTRCSFI